MGIEKIKSKLTNDIFCQEMLHIYEQKGQSRDKLVAEVRRTMLELANEMRQGVCEHPEVETLLLTLSHNLKSEKGKKQYGYLPKSVKKQVDEIVDQMARLPSVNECYNKWLGLQQEVSEFYSSKPVERVPLSQQKEFCAIHNAVVQVTIQLGKLTFGDRNLEQHDEPENILQDSETCGRLWSVIRDDSLPLDLRDAGVDRLRAQAEGGDPYALFLLGRLYWDGPSLPYAILAVNSLLRQMGRIFQDNARIMDSTQGQHTDRKLRRRIQEKKIAMGHKPDDHEEQTHVGPAM